MFPQKSHSSNVVVDGFRKNGEIVPVYARKAYSGSIPTYTETLALDGRFLTGKEHRYP